MALTLTDNDVYQSGSGGFLASHTLPDIDASGANAIAIGVGFNRNPVSDVTGWTFEGTAGTLVANAINANVVAVSMYFATSSSAAETIVSNTPSFKLQAMIGASFTDGHQSAPVVGTPSTGTGFNSTGTLSVTGTAGNTFVVGVSTQGDRTFTASGCTLINQVTHADANVGSGFLGYVAATGSPQTIGASWGTGDNYAIVVAEIKPATVPVQRRVFII